MELRWDVGTKVYSNDLGHITNMATMPIYGKNRIKISPGTKRLMTLKRGMQDRVLEFYQDCSNSDPGLTLTYFMARSNMVPYAFVWKKLIDFSETIVVYNIEVGRFSN